ncbi:WD40 repeat domain-containing protein [Nonomuraea rubra]|uniref:WD40 repeat protein n=1 Tax=Nonomuraea rubra TaxID=46180 RepID=A0A7X0NPF4_9ACTN|nr:WD40 repeat protein [Nonomuraea rubra]
MELPVLFDRLAAGGHASLRLELLRDAPPGLYPMPGRMTFLVADHAFADALDAAWQAIPRLHERCVLWSLTDGRHPCNDVIQGSLAASFALGLDELHRQSRKLGRYRLRRLDHRCAVTGGLDDEGRLLPVGGYRAKLQEAVRQRWRVVLPVLRPADQVPPELLREARARQARDLTQAIRLTRTRLNERFVGAATAVILGMSSGGVVAARAIDAAERAHRQALAGRLIGEAGDLLNREPRLALRLGLAAVRLGGAEGARAALLKNLLTTRYAGELPLFGLSHPAFSPDGRMLSTTSEDGGVILWDTATRTAITTIDVPKPDPRRSAFSRDRSMIAIPENRGDITLWNLADPRTPRKVGVIPGLFANQGYAGDEISALVFSPDGRFLTVVRDADVLEHWEITIPENPRLRHSEPSERGRVGAEGLALSEDGRILASLGNQRLTLWDASGGAALRKLGTVLDDKAGSIRAIALSRDGRTLAALHTGGIILLDITNPVAPTQLAIARRSVEIPGSANQLAFGLDDRYLVTDRGVSGEVWDITRPSEPSFVDGATDEARQMVHLGASPHLPFLVTVDGSPRAKLWRLTSLSRPAPVAIVPGRDGRTTSAAFSPDAGLTTVSSAGEVLVWEMSDPAHPVVIGRAPPTQRHRSETSSRLFSGKDGIVAVGRGQDSTELWDLSDRRRPRQMAGVDGKSPVAIGSSGRLLAVTDRRKRTLELWQLPATTPLAGLDGWQGELRSAAISPNGRLLALLDSDRTVEIWDIADAHRPRRLAKVQETTGGRRGQITFTPDGHRLITTTSETPGTIWDLADPTRPRPLDRRDGQIASDNSAIVTPDGHGLIQSLLGVTTVWEITDRPTHLFTFNVASGIFHPAALSTSGVLITPLFDGVSPYDWAGQMVVWDFATHLRYLGDPSKAACELAGPLTDHQWAQRVRELPFERTC